MHRHAARLSLLASGACTCLRHVPTHRRACRLVRLSVCSLSMAWMFASLLLHLPRSHPICEHSDAAEPDLWCLFTNAATWLPRVPRSPPQCQLQRHTHNHAHAHTGVRVRPSTGAELVLGPLTKSNAFLNLGDLNGSSSVGFDGEPPSDEGAFGFGDDVVAGPQGAKPVIVRAPAMLCATRLRNQQCLAGLPSAWRARACTAACGVTHLKLVSMWAW